MKKLLVLMLVLGMASTSYGYIVSISEFTLTLDEATDVLIISSTIDLSADNLAVGWYDESVQGDFSTPTAVLGSPARAGSLQNVSYDSVYDGVSITAGSTGLESPAWDAVAGDWFTIRYSGDIGDTLAVYDFKVSDTVSIGDQTIVPEPMTVALLGLGSLFLLRRRK